MNTMTRNRIDDPGSGWANASRTADDLAHEEAFAREAAAYLRASGLPEDEIERALCDEVGLSASVAHQLALAG
jgi:hypothetical protein